MHRDTNPLKLQFPQWVKRIDAVMTWHHNKRTYFFSGPYYWRYDNNAKRFDIGYPKKTQVAWRGLPKRIDAAFSSNIEKKTFFISGNKYYLMDDS